MKSQNNVQTICKDFREIIDEIECQFTEFVDGNHSQTKMYLIDCDLSLLEILKDRLIDLYLKEIGKEWVDRIKKVN
jgi:hypothetical protein